MDFFDSVFFFKCKIYIPAPLDETNKNNKARDVVKYFVCCTSLLMHPIYINIAASISSTLYI